MSDSPSSSTNQANNKLNVKKTKNNEKGIGFYITVAVLASVVVCIKNRDICLRPSRSIFRNLVVNPAFANTEDLNGTELVTLVSDALMP